MSDAPDPSDDPGTGDDPGTAPRAAAAAAPASKPKGREARRQWRDEERARRYAARGSVRFPVFTRSVTLWWILFALTGLAFGAAGAFFYASFNTQVAELRDETRGFDAATAEATAELETLRQQALDDINNQLAPLAPYLAEARTIQLAQQFAPYVYFVETFDEEGRPAVGSGFTVASSERESLLLASATTLRASAVRPGPEVKVRADNGEQIPASVVSFDQANDLAVLRIDRGNLPVLEWAGDDVQAALLGTRVFPVGGLGGAGATLTSGIVIDQFAGGFLHTAPVGTAMQGGPIVTAEGRVVGVVSVTYQPLGFDPGDLHYSVSVNSACVQVLDCGGGTRVPR